jgi:hypothetical protein
MIFRLILRQRTKVNKSCYCTQSQSKNKVYSSTIFLPKTKFPLRLDSKKLLERDEQVASVSSTEI